jgi:NAD(P)H-hydrate epimerase
MKLVTVAEMRAIEEEANQKGYSYDLMMEKAGNGVAAKLLLWNPDQSKKTVTAFVGSGNNGGDALTALVPLLTAGWAAFAYLVKERKDDPLVMKVEKAGGEIILYPDDNKLKKLDTILSKSDVLLDGLLGTGFQLPLKEPYLSVLKEINKKNFKGYVVAIDCPSGVDCDSGQVADDCIKADTTVCMEAIKVGLLSFPAYQYVGRLDVVSLDLPRGLKTLEDVKREVATAECVRQLLPNRPLQAHKGTFGTALVVAGSINYTGAALLSGKAAYRIGAGLVQMGVPGPLYAALAGNFVEATWILLPHDMGVIKAEGAALLNNNLKKATALLLGPGWGVEDTTKEFLERILSGNFTSQRKKSGIGFVMMDADEEELVTSNLPPIVVDADGLKLLQKIENWFKLLPKNSVITPHPGEMSVLTEMPINEIQNDRLRIAREYAALWNQVVVLKGAMTVISAPDERQTIVAVANPALARAGTGDVLAGISTGLIAQGIEPYQASVAGVWIHAQAGLEASEFVGHPAAVMATDVLNAIPKVLEKLG